LQQKQPGSERARLYIYQGGIAMLAIAYLLQMATPLRLHTDSIIMLSLAESAAHGGGFLYHGQSTVFPPGYPALVAVLLRIGLPRVWALIGINAAGLLLGLWAIRPILARRFGYDVFAIGNICILSLLSFVWIRIFAIPLTDLCFFGLAMCCLALMESASDVEFRLALRRILASWVIVALAISVRRVGIALIPPLIGAAILRPEVRTFASRWSPWTKAAMAVCGGSLAGLTAWIVARTSTLSDFRSVVAGHSLWDAASQIVAWRLRELGEMAVNVPFPVSPVMERLLLLVGILAVGVILAGIAAKRHAIGPTEIFVVSYGLILLSWPFYDPRFWLPVIPLLIGYAGLALRRFLRHRLWFAASRAYLVLYASLGLLTIESSTMVTFSGPNFPNVYQDESYRATYCAVYRSCIGPAPTVPLNEAALHVYQVYK
jgi:hypothetical protein